MRLTPAARISLGLVALAVSLVLIADLLIGFLPDEVRWMQTAKLQRAESLAVQVAVIADNPDALQRTLRGIVSRDAEIASIALRESSGAIIASGGNHSKHWHPMQLGEVRPGQFVIPMYRNAGHWGNLEVAYHGASMPAWEAFIRRPSIYVAAILVTFGLIAYFLYLRRVLQHLDPSSVVPERVRMAFDVLTEAVMVLDSRGRIVLINEGFKALVPPQESAMGKNPSDLAWLVASMGKDPKKHPWAHAMQSRQSVTGEELEISIANGSARRVVVNCAPILDGANVARGCLVTLDDVTALQYANSELVKANQQLQESRLEIERQNSKLKRLATRDPMTGCLNRRAFFESAAPTFSKALAQHEPLCVILCDIDHFKRFNDQNGHSVGDQVIVAVAKMLKRGLRSFDLLCRYGGEEFCILLPSTSHQQAMEVASRLRLGIEQSAGAAVRTMQGLKVTCSFGVATLIHGQIDLGAVIDRADEALYTSKQQGRNRVTLWTSQAPQALLSGAES